MNEFIIKIVWKYKRSLIAFVLFIGIFFFLIFRELIITRTAIVTIIKMLFLHQFFFLFRKTTQHTHTQDIPNSVMPCN